jgi:hypothetical protein
MTYKMLRPKKSSNLLPIVRLTNYFYPETAEEADAGALGLTSTDAAPAGVSVDGPQPRCASSSSNKTGSSTPPPEYDLLYQALQLGSNLDGFGEERVRKKYACQGSSYRFLYLVTGLKLVASAIAEDTSALSSKEIGFSRDLYINGVEYILRGLPRIACLCCHVTISEPLPYRETTHL